MINMTMHLTSKMDQVVSTPGTTILDIILKHLEPLTINYFFEELISMDRMTFQEIYEHHEWTLMLHIAVT